MVTVNSSGNKFIFQISPTNGFPGKASHLFVKLPIRNSHRGLPAPPQDNPEPHISRVPSLIGGRPPPPIPNANDNWISGNWEQPGKY
jgi:hypothetical protein